MPSNDNIIINEVVLFDVEDPILPPTAEFVYNYYTTDERLTDEKSRDKMSLDVRSTGIRKGRFADGSMPPRLVKLGFKFSRGAHHSLFKNQGNGLFMDVNTGVVHTPTDILSAHGINLPESTAAGEGGRSTPIRFNGLLKDLSFETDPDTGAAIKPINTEASILPPLMISNAAMKDNRQMVMRIRDLSESIFNQIKGGEYRVSDPTSAAEMSKLISDTLGDNVDGEIIGKVIDKYDKFGTEQRAGSFGEKTSRNIADNPSNSVVKGIVDSRAIRDMNNRSVRVIVNKKHQADLMRISMKSLGALNPTLYHKSYADKNRKIELENAATSKKAQATFAALQDQLCTTAVVIDNNSGVRGNKVLAGADVALNDFSQIVLIGHVIEKFKISSEDGGKRPIESFLFLNDYGFMGSSERNPRIKFNDTKVRYGEKYSYRSRYLYCVRFFDSHPTSKNHNHIKSFLVLSRESEESIVACEEFVPPPPPTVIKYRFNYTEDKGMILSWQIPNNPQSDIVKYQIFRRESVLEPFELIRQIDFDKSSIRTPSREIVRGDLVSFASFHTNIYEDTEFTRADKYIYAICSVDAHGLTSNYSPQIEVSFDADRNKIVKKTISNNPTPKQYPNLYINSTDSGFESSARITHDVMKISNYDKIRVYFDPEAIFVKSEQGNIEKDRQLIAFHDEFDQDKSDDNKLSFDKSKYSRFTTEGNRGLYKFSMINLDRQLSKTLTFKVRVRKPNEDPSQIGVASESGEIIMTRVNLTYDS